LFNLGHQGNQKSVNIFAVVSANEPLIENNDDNASEENNQENEEKLKKEQQLPEASIKEMKYQYESKT
jgi:hypothetical protein